MGSGEIGSAHVAMAGRLFGDRSGRGGDAAGQTSRPLADLVAASLQKYGRLRSVCRSFNRRRYAAAEELDRIAELSPDLIVVMAYGQILPKRLLEMPTLACLNLHASILPRHRGAAPIQASILAGDRSTGLTVMYMAEGLDTGDILLTRSIAIRRRETGGSLHDRLATLGPEALASAFELILSGKAPQDPAG